MVDIAAHPSCVVSEVTAEATVSAGAYFRLTDPPTGGRLRETSKGTETSDVRGRQHNILAA
jgi:hypothetical protein